jgi:hypothetical protein
MYSTNLGVSIDLSPGHAHQVVELVSGESTPTPVRWLDSLFGSASFSGFTRLEFALRLASFVFDSGQFLVHAQGFLRIELKDELVLGISWVISWGIVFVTAYLMGFLGLGLSPGWPAAHSLGLISLDLQGFVVGSFHTW